MAVPIVTYHRVTEPASPLSVPPRVFDMHLDAFAASGYRTVSMADVLEWIRHGRQAPADALVITFDDGDESVYREAWPRLQARSFTATVFLVADHCGGTSRWAGQPLSVPAHPLLGWDHVGVLGRAGWEFGAHSRTHPPLTTLGPDAIEEEAVGSQRIIRERTGQQVRAFAYPYGAVNARVREIVRRHFAGAVTAQLGLATVASDPCLLPRIDAYYLRPGHIPYLRTAAYSAYLSARQAARWVRRRVREDWQHTGSAGPALRV